MSLRKNFILPFIFAALVVFSMPLVSFAEGEYVKGDVVVVFRPSDSGEKITASSFSENGAGQVSASALALAAGAEVKNVYPALSAAGNAVFAVLHSDDADPESLSEALLKNPNVLAASPNYIVRAAAVEPNDKYWSQLWNMEAINMPDAWEYETGDSTIYAAILDSGIDWTNPDVSANVSRTLGTNILSPSNSAMDDYGHGTHVAGIMGAVGNNGTGVPGINWSISMIPIKVLDSTGGGNVSGVIAGINYVIDLMDQGYNIRVVNLSLETYTSYRPTYNDMVRFPLWRAFKELDDFNQAVIVVAAGNNEVTIGSPTTSSKYNSTGQRIYSSGEYVYPASFVGLNNMISVSAVRRNYSIASYSNTNANISAPGGNIYRDLSTVLSTWKQNSNYVDSDGVAVYYAQGTSMAAPHVGGAAALLAAHMPSMTAYQIKQCIMETRNMNYAEGLLDVAAALEYQEYYASTLEPESKENKEYDNYDSQQADPLINDNNPVNYEPYDYQDESNNNNDNGGGGGCNGFMFGGLAVVFLFPLVKKFMS